MTFSTQSPDEVDVHLAINTAARHMTSASHSPELRARVMSRIDAAQPRWHWGWRLAMAGGAIGAVALTTAVMWHEQPASAPSVLDVASAATAAVIPVATPEVLTAPGVTIIVPMPQPARQTFAVSAAELEWRARAVPALAEPNALHVAPLEHTELMVTPLDIAPLTVPPLVAMTTGAGGSK